MSTAVALQEPQEARQPPMSKPLDETERPAWAVEYPPKKRGRSTVIKAVKWASIVGLLALAGLWSRVTPFEVVARFIVDAGAIVVMAQALLARHYALATVSGTLVFLYNPLAPVFYLSGDWQRAALVASATPFLVALVWRDMRTAHNLSEAGDPLENYRMEEVTNMISNRPAGTAFREGDEVVLDRGTYQGTPGVFVRLGKDINWADIMERNGTLRSHPVAWLAHAAAIIVN